ncbi:lipoyl synthase [Candidatus Fermentibacteria bacterium]|nr:MAG: lipoyl synthase [Candidatus Fermentibacteria bacterium]
MLQKDTRKKPEWLKMPTIGNSSAGEVRRVLRELELNTVCSEAKCPNRGHCFQRGTATFLIMGHVCTRNCRYCAIERNIKTPPPLDPDEPARVAEASARMNLRYVVLTSVTRDDLPDGGAGHIAATVKAIKEKIPGVRVEVLTPDFKGSIESLRTVAASAPSVFNHNLETVERLFPYLRPIASYRKSLEVLRLFGETAPSIPRKSGIMAGLGETEEDMMKTLEDLRENGVTLLTIGQYLQPTSRHLPVVRFLEPSEFENWEKRALEMGFTGVASGALVRSSYQADILADARKVQQ